MPEELRELEAWSSPHSVFQTLLCLLCSCPESRPPLLRPPLGQSSAVLHTDSSDEASPPAFGSPFFLGSQYSCLTFCGPFLLPEFGGCL